MDNIAIRTDNLSKLYRIGARQEPYKTLRESLMGAMAAPFRKFRHPGVVGRNNDLIWALKDVSFEIRAGEVVGIIGRNGAGKSTLLKILSRITSPTEGSAEIRGRVGSLLEVGTGFHPELTGRENIFLNGAILGMFRAETQRKFDDIVAFAEVEKFIDTPVKYYSSGMYVRLAFAVAAHMETEILLVDEVLAVGDAAFQEKCLGAMKKTAASGRTVLFVSHNMTSIQHLCTRAILLQEGRVALDGYPTEVIGDYLSGVPKGHSVSIADWPDRKTSGEAHLVKFEITDEQGRLTNSIPVGGGVRFTFHAEFSQPLTDPCFGVIVQSALGEPILNLQSIHDGLRLGRVDGSVTVHMAIETVGLYPGRYFLSPWIMDAACLYDIDFVKLCSTLEVEPAPGPYGDLKLNPMWGKYWLKSHWSV
ncbi:ABC transporter ATP-binding protein [bacterium]|nr:MAG: ABC transporter ATP-binding protein [bacterium]